MAGIKLPIIAAIALAVFISAGAFAAMQLARPSNVVGNPSSVAVVMPAKWKRVKAPMGRAPAIAVDRGAFQCPLQLCEDESLVIIGILKAKGMLAAIDAAGQAQAADADAELTYDQALDLFRQSFGADRQAMESNMKATTVGPLRGYRTTSTIRSLGPNNMAFAIELLQAGDFLILLSAASRDGDIDKAEARLPELEDQIWLNNARIVQ